MYWRSYSPEIKRVLALKGSPIAVTYSMVPPRGQTVSAAQFARRCSMRALACPQASTRTAAIAPAERGI
jgi:hypothetical protein